MFTGTLIEDLIDTVDRVQHEAQTDEMMLDIELWIAAAENSGYESAYLGVA